jgi:hypothetical protein
MCKVEIILTEKWILVMRRIVVCAALGLTFLSGCSQYYLSVGQQWIDARYLASSHAHTPDPRQGHPPVGQMLVIDWRVPEEILKQKPEVVLELILWDYTTKTVRYPITKKMDYTTFKLLNEEYEKCGGILTYKASILTPEGKPYREWKHQLWVNLITVE